MRSSKFNNHSLPHNLEKNPFTVLAYELRSIGYNTLKASAAVKQAEEKKSKVSKIHKAWLGINSQIVGISYDFLYLINSLKQQRLLQGELKNSSLKADRTVGAFRHLNVTLPAEEVFKQAFEMVLDDLHRYSDSPKIQSILKRLENLGISKSSTKQDFDAVVKPLVKEPV